MMVNYFSMHAFNFLWVVSKMGSEQRVLRERKVLCIPPQLI